MAGLPVPVLAGLARPGRRRALQVSESGESFKFNNFKFKLLLAPTNFPWTMDR